MTAYPCTIMVRRFPRSGGVYIVPQTLPRRVYDIRTHKIYAEIEQGTIKANNCIIAVYRRHGDQAWTSIIEQLLATQRAAPEPE